MNAMDSIFLPRFTIGENAFDAFHDEMGRYGKKVAVIHGERAWKAAREYVVPALEKAGLTITTEWLYGHDATHENADKISNDPAVQEADMLLAVGGGKCIDTAKLAADHLGKPVFTAPSIASNCAPVTQISIMYHEDGSFCDIPRLKEVPVHCFINPKLVLAAPVKYLWAGIGDAMAKHVESSWSAWPGLCFLAVWADLFIIMWGSAPVLLSHFFWQSIMVSPWCRPYFHQKNIMYGQSGSGKQKAMMCFSAFPFSFLWRRMTIYATFPV